jgi:hypothetical protein
MRHSLVLERQKFQTIQYFHVIVHLINQDQVFALLLVQMDYSRPRMHQYPIHRMSESLLPFVILSCQTSAPYLIGHLQLRHDHLAEEKE